MRNRFLSLISSNPNKLPRQLYLPTVYYRDSTCTRLSAISRNLHRAHWRRSISLAIGPLIVGRECQLPEPQDDRLDQCCRVTQRRCVHLRIIYLNLSKPVTARSYERSRARIHTHTHTQTHGNPHTHATPERKADTSAPNSPS